jgi:cytidylate kinase
VGLDNDDTIFIEESNLIKKLAEENSCVIVGRCADFILKDNKDVISIFIYSTMEDKIKRATKYYHIPEGKALKEINKINKARRNHYKYYTNRDWYNLENYDFCFNVSHLGIEKTVDLISDIILENKD